jgi:hypothetical protein
MGQTIFELYDRVKAFDLKKVVDEIVEDSSGEFLEMNKDQMLAGQTSKGEDIRPYYSENPYFKKPGAAQRYADWKARTTPDSRRKNDVPNLITSGFPGSGTFHGQLRVEDNGWRIGASGSLASKVLSVHDNVLGVNPENTGKWVDEKANPKLFEKFQAVL